MLLKVEPNQEPHWKSYVSDDVYHSDKSRVSSTMLKPLFMKSPATFKAQYDGGTKETPSLRFGRLAHKAVLEGPEFLSQFVVQPKFSGTGSKARKEEWLAENAGRIIVTQDELDAFRGMIDSLIDHPDARLILESCEVEKVGYYADPLTGLSCKAKLDCINHDVGLIADFKTTTDISYSKFAWDVQKLRYDYQLAFYGTAAEVIDSKTYEDFAHVAIEKERPYEVAVYTYKRGDLERGFETYREAMDRLKECLDTGEWPRYQERAQAMRSWAS